jgi:hypothetical protein
MRPTFLCARREPELLGSGSKVERSSVSCGAWALEGVLVNQLY